MPGADENTMYQMVLTNLPKKQAQALYRFLVDLEDTEDLSELGPCWSGLISRGNISDPPAGVTIRPMELPSADNRRAMIKVWLQTSYLTESSRARLTAELKELEGEDPSRVVQGHMAVLMARMGTLMAAISIRDWEQVEFEYDRVLRSISKLTAMLGLPCEEDEARPRTCEH